MTVISFRNYNAQTAYKKMIMLPGTNGRTLLDFSVELGQLLRETPLFRYNNMLASLTEDGSDAKFNIINPTSLITYVDRYVKPYSVGAKGMRTYKSLQYSLTKLLLEVPEFTSQLREVKRCNYVRLPIYDAEQKIILSPPGYHEQSKTITLDKIQFEYDWPLERARHFISEMLCDFIFEGRKDHNRFKANAICGMVGAFVSGLLPERIVRPCIYVGANDSGAGKGTLVRMMTCAVHGSAASISPVDDEEMRKFLFSCVMEGRNVIIIDNIKGRIDSPILQQFLTAVNLDGRILGTNTTFQGEVFASVFLTGNRCRLSQDTYRRILPIMLRINEANFSNRQYKYRLSAAALEELRPQFLSALWAIVRAWDAAGRPLSKTINNSFPEWSAMVGGIVEAAGFDDLNVDLKTVEMDDDLIDMELVVAGMQVVGDYSYSLMDMMRIALKLGAFEDIIDENSITLTFATTKRKLQAVLGRFHARKIKDYYFYTVGKGLNRRYFLSPTPIPNTDMYKELQARKSPMEGQI